MTTGAATLSGMAEAEAVITEADGPPEPGMVQCRASGCNNWFRKQSGRHIYCKLEGCTYKRGGPTGKLGVGVGAAEELLKRLEEREEPEAGPTMYVERTRAIQDALRAGDPRATWGALIDSAAVQVVWADRVANGELEATLPTRERTQQAAQKPGAFVQAVLASHHRTFVLAERRVEAVYELAGARESYASTVLALEQTQGSPQEADARDAHREAKRRVDQAERALQSIEAAWAERGASLQQLEGAAVASGVLTRPGSNGN